MLKKMINGNLLVARNRKLNFEVFNDWKFLYENYFFMKFFLVRVNGNG